MDQNQECRVDPLVGHHLWEWVAHEAGVVEAVEITASVTEAGEILVESIIAEATTIFVAVAAWIEVAEEAPGQFHVLSHWKFD